MGMLLVRGAHATTLGFMAAVGRLKFGKHIVPAKHKWSLRLLAGFFILGYPWLFVLWLATLLIDSLRGRVVAGRGFLVVLSEPRTDQRPAVGDITVGAMVAVSCVGAATYLIVALTGESAGHPALGWLGLVITLGAALGSALVRIRREDRSSLHGAVIVRGFVPTSRRSRRTGREAASTWLTQQTCPTGWIADEGLRSFYEEILAPWGVKGDLITKERTGFWGVLWPRRYVFVKP